MTKITDTQAPQRVIAYIDGFNLYHGIRDAKWRRYLWLDVHALAGSLLRPHQTLIKTKYFTARISGPPDKAQRQSTYIDALTALDVLVVEGRYQLKDRICPKCKHKHSVPEEKETDVNIAVAMAEDALSNLCDTALLISGDADLKAPLMAVKAAGKRAIVAFPPRRHSDVLEYNASALMHIGRSHLGNNQLPTEVTTASGFVLTRPPEWA